MSVSEALSTSIVDTPIPPAIVSAIEERLGGADYRGTQETQDAIQIIRNAPSIRMAVEALTQKSEPAVLNAYGAAHLTLRNSLQALTDKNGAYECVQGAFNAQGLANTEEGHKVLQLMEHASSLGNVRHELSVRCDPEGKNAYSKAFQALETFEESKHYMDVASALRPFDHTYAREKTGWVSKVSARGHSPVL